MKTDPDSIQEDVAADADAIYWATELDDVQAMKVAIAAALDALFTEEPIVFIRTYRIPLTIAPGDKVHVDVKPSEFLAAVLAREVK